MRTPARGLQLLVAVLIAATPAALATPAAVAAQGWVGTQTVQPPAWAEALHIDTRPESPLVGVAVAYPVGSGADAPGLPGVGRVTAEAVVIAVEERLGAGQAEGRVRVEPDHTLLTFVVRTERVSALLDAIGSITRSPLDDRSIAASLRQRAEVLRFEVDSPVNEVDAARRALFHGEADSRVRPPGGLLGVVESDITSTEVEAARRTLFAEGAHLAIVGAVAAPAAAPAPAPAPDAPAPAAPVARTGAETTSPGPPWSGGDRQVVHREVTNSWITVAYPVPAGLPRIAVLYLADRMDRELGTQPPDPGLFTASAEVMELPGGEAIVVRAAVLPEATDRFEARILDLPRALALERDPTFFRFHRGRFRASRLIAEASPEIAADRMALELVTRGAVLDFDAAVWELDVTVATEVATALGEPRILIFGPDLGG